MALAASERLCIFVTQLFIRLRVNLPYTYAAARLWLRQQLLFHLQRLSCWMVNEEAMVSARTAPGQKLPCPFITFTDFV
jgi:hypothetical protein